LTKRSLAAPLAIFFLVSFAKAQNAEVVVTLTEPFFDSFLDAVFQNFDPPEFPIAWTVDSPKDRRTSGEFRNASFDKSGGSGEPRVGGNCVESVKILREMNGVRTAVKFRDGKVVVPLAFTGNYAPPFIGCVNFSGWAEANIDISFDQPSQKLIGRVRVVNVNLNGTGGVGGTVIAKLIQSSIDRKLNPIEILSLDKMSFLVPIQNSGNIRMRAKSVRTELGNSFLNVHIMFEFTKA